MRLAAALLSLALLSAACSSSEPRADGAATPSASASPTASPSPSRTPAAVAVTASPSVEAAVAQPSPVVSGGGALPANATCKDFYEASPEARNTYSGFRLLEARDFSAVPTETEIDVFFGWLALKCAADEQASTPLETVVEQVLQEDPALLN